MFRRCFKEAAPWWDAAAVGSCPTREQGLLLNVLWKLGESERFLTITATYYRFNPPWPLRRAVSEKRMERERERERHGAGNWKHGEQMFRWRGSERKMIPDQFPAQSSSLIDAALRLIDVAPPFMYIWAVNLSVWPQKVPLTAQCDAARPPARFCCIYNSG